MEFLLFVLPQKVSKKVKADPNPPGVLPGWRHRYAVIKSNFKICQNEMDDLFLSLILYVIDSICTCFVYVLTFCLDKKSKQKSQDRPGAGIDPLHGFVCV